MLFVLQINVTAKDRPKIGLVLSGGDATDILLVGKEMGKQYYPYFKRLADSLNSIQHIAYSPANRMPVKGDVTIDEIEYIGIKNIKQDLLEDKIGIKSGHSYSISQINNGFKGRLFQAGIQYCLLPVKAKRGRTCKTHMCY